MIKKLNFIFFNKDNPSYLTMEEASRRITDHEGSKSDLNDLVLFGLPSPLPDGLKELKFDYDPIIELTHFPDELTELFTPMIKSANKR